MIIRIRPHPCDCRLFNSSYGSHTAHTAGFDADQCPWGMPLRDAATEAGSAYNDARASAIAFTNLNIYLSRHKRRISIKLRNVVHNGRLYTARSAAAASIDLSAEAACDNVADVTDQLAHKVPRLQKLEGKEYEAAEDGCA